MFASNVFCSLPPACHESTGLEKFNQEEEDPSMDPTWPHLQIVDTVIRGPLRYFPVTNNQKEVLFLGQWEEVMEIAQSSEFQCFMVPLFRHIRRCLNCSHFQVCTTALFSLDKAYCKYINIIVIPPISNV